MTAPHRPSTRSTPPRWTPWPRRPRRTWSAAPSWSRRRAESWTHRSKPSSPKSGAGWPTACRRNNMPGILSPYLAALDDLEPMLQVGEVVEMAGLLIESAGPAAAIGDFCEISASGGRCVRSQVIGFRDGRVLSMPLEETGGIELGNRVVARRDAARVAVGPALAGRVLDGFGHPIDHGPRIEAQAAYSLYSAAPGPLDREHITRPLETGLRAVDGLLPVGQGQRIGIFGGSGDRKRMGLG